MANKRTRIQSPPQRQYASATAQGTLLEVAVRCNWSQAILPEKRGIVSGFTRAARTRMLKAIARLDWDTYGKSVFVTVTYPDAYRARKPATRTQDRTLLLRAVERELGHQVSALWRLEYKRRITGKHVGQLMPHFHLVLLGVPYICQHAVRRAWRTVLGHVGPLATDVRASRDGLHTAKYLAKYAAKVQSLDALDDVSYLDMRGRHWGLTRKDTATWAPVHTAAPLSATQQAAAMLIARYLLGRQYEGSYFLFHSDARGLLEQIEKEVGWPLDTATKNG